MKFWKRLRLAGTCLFVLLLVVLWWAYEPSRATPEPAEGVRPMPTIVR
jgi:hypothetical protein